MELVLDSLTELDVGDAHEAIDRLEADIAEQPGAFFDFPLMHRFTNGLYSRQIYMPKDTLLTSEIHQTQHQFAILMGAARVWTPETREWTLLKAPFVGITEPGTRRVLHILEDCVWITFHPNSDNETDPEKIEWRILDKEHRAMHHQLKNERMELCPTPQ